MLLQGNLTISLLEIFHGPLPSHFGSHHVPSLGLSPPFNDDNMIPSPIMESPLTSSRKEELGLGIRYSSIDMMSRKASSSGDGNPAWMEPSFGIEEGLIRSRWPEGIGWSFQKKSRSRLNAFRIVRFFSMVTDYIERSFYYQEDSSK